MSPAEALKVGDTVMLCSVNHKPVETKVTAVGRKLVRVAADDGSFRLDNGLRRNDEYHHEWLLTPAQFRRRAEVSAAIDELRSLGVQLSLGRAAIDHAPEILAAVRTVLP